jgi:hypothetical protein
MEIVCFSETSVCTVGLLTSLHSVTTQNITIVILDSVRTSNLTCALFISTIFYINKLTVIKPVTSLVMWSTVHCEQDLLLITHTCSAVLTGTVFVNDDNLTKKVTSHITNEAVKQSRCRHACVKGERRCNSYSFLTSALDRGE